MTKKLLTIAATITMAVIVSLPTLAADVAHGIPLREACIVPGAQALQTRVSEHTRSETEIMDLERLSCRMLGNPETVGKAMEFIIAENGRILLDGAGIAENRDAQAAMFKAYFEAGFDIAYEPFEAVVSESDDIGWAIGLFKETKPNGAIEIGKYVSIWHRIDGQWKNVIEMRNSDGGLPIVK